MNTVELDNRKHIAAAHAYNDMNDTTLQTLSTFTNATADFMRRISVDEKLHNALLDWPEWDKLRSQLFSANACLAQHMQERKS